MVKSGLEPKVAELSLIKKPMKLKSIEKTGLKDACTSYKFLKILNHINAVLNISSLHFLELSGTTIPKVRSTT